MDLIKILKSVKTLNDYISLTQELNHNKYKNVKISLNMSTVLSLKNIRSLEIEYFNKCHDNGAAFNIFGRMLALPPSKTWSLLGKELVSMLQYWLDAVRKHLISHHPHWWLFLKTLLKFIKELSKKENGLNNTLVQELSDGLLDLATRGRTSVVQRHEILHTFNQYCAESGREVRLRLRMEFDHYFVRLSTMMASCGHAPTQYSTLETLLRWLLPRRDPALRQEAAARWLPHHLYANGVRQIFLERPWMNFFQDARDLLNIHNTSSGHVTSVICRKLSIGERVIVSGTEKRPTWLDLNRGSGSLSILMDPKAVMDALNINDCSGCEAIIISNDNTRAAKLYKESVQVMLSITTLEPPKLFPCCADVSGGCDVAAVLGGRALIGGVDAALRDIFQDKYEVSLNIDDTTISPEKFVNNQEDDTRFSQPAKEVGRHTHSGFTAWSRNPASWKSPSTASTSSLAQLHDKLAALPHYRFDKEPVSVCAQPKLSRLTELSESDDKQSFDNTNSTLKLGPYGVCHRSLLDKSHSDDEVKGAKAKETAAKNKAFDVEPAKRRTSRSDSEEVRKSKNYSEILEESRNASLLLVAAVGSADESVINDTLERLSTNKDYSGHNIVDLLVQEALQAKAGKEDDDKCLDSGINTDDGKKTQDIGETVVSPEKTTAVLEANKHNYTVISVSTSTDESNTEAINDTPMCYVSVRKKNIQRKNSVDKILPTITEALYDEKAVEDFFSQHFYDNNRSELLISPTLARKINETSTESSEFGECLIRNDEDCINMNQYEIPDKDIIECLNYMVDKVCNDFDKYLEQEKGGKGDIVEGSESILREVKEKTPLRDIGNTEELYKADDKDSKPAKKRGLKLKYKLNTVNKKTKATQKKGKSNKNKLELKSAEMSTVFENEDIHEEPKPASPKTTVNYSSPENKNRLIRRKRKLYSPKDDNIVASQPTEFNVDVPIINESVPPNKDNEELKKCDDDDVPISELKKRNSVKPKTTATSYKDIEKDRQRIKRIRAKKVASPDSPKTRKLNEVFDHLKDNIESNEKITLADKTVFNEDMAIFNFTSDSEDEDFKKKKVDIQKKISTTTINSGKSVISHRGRSHTKVNYSEKGKVSSDEAVKPAARKRGKRKNSKTKTPKALKVDKLISLVDERMRAAPPAKEGVLDTSIVVEKIKETEIVEEPVPAIAVSEIEFATEDEVNTQQICNAIEVKKKSKKTERVVKKDKANKEAGLEVVKEKDDDGTISPLPGLVVETVNNDRNYEESLNSTFVKKVQKMYKSGADLCINDTNTTHNLLSDNEKINITDEFNFIQDNVEDNASFNVNAPDKENEFVNKNYSEISPIKTVQDDQGMTDKSVASSNTKREKQNLRLKSSDAVIHSDSDAKFSLSSLKTTSKPKRIQNKDDPSVNNVSNLQKVCQKANSTEIIWIEDESQHSKRSQAKLNKSQEIIEINDDVYSEKSIASNCINAHGDLNEEPPSQKSLDRPLLPREIADMDESVVEYYVRLGKELENSRNSKSNETIDNSKENVAKKVASPVLSLKRMPSEEIRNWTTPKSQKGGYDYRRWLPSRKDSESDNSKSNETIDNFKENVAKKVASPVLSLKRMSSQEIRKWIPPKSKREDYDYRRWLPSRQDSESDNSKSNETIDNSKENVAIASPVLSLKRMSSQEIRKWIPPKSKKEDYDYRRWLPSRQDSEPDNNTVSSEKSLSVSVARLSAKEIAEWTGKGANKKSSDESKDDNNNSSSENVIRSPLLKNSSTNRNQATNEQKKRRSVISPVKLFDDAIGIPKRKIRPKVCEEKPSNETSSKDATEQMNRKSIISPVKLFDDSVDIPKRKTRPKVCEEKPSNKTSSKNATQSEKTATPRRFANETLSPESNMSTSTRIEESRRQKTHVKRTLPMEEKVDAKRRKVEMETAALSESDPTMSSVEDWLKKIETNKAGLLDASISDMIQNIMERLDTTVREIHQNTSKIFQHLFVEAQRQLGAQMRERREMHRRSAAKVKRFVDEEYAELDRRSQEMEDSFMEALQQRATNFIKDDLKQKRAVVQLLREDVQTFMDYVSKKSQK